MPKNLFGEVWAGYRPYLVKITIDFLVTASLWVGLFTFKVLIYFVPVSGWPGRFIDDIHSAGIVAAFGVFVVISVTDIIQIHGGPAACFA